jgi:RecA-family ATPase
VKEFSPATPTHLSEFSTELKEALARYAKRKKVSAYYEQNQIFIRYVYYFVRYKLAKGDSKHGSVERMIERANKKGLLKSRRSRENPFRVGLLLLRHEVGHDMPDSSVTKFSVQLLYAHEHDVPPQWLTGFLVQAGGYEKIKTKVDRKKREDWMLEWRMPRTVAD